MALPTSLLRPVAVQKSDLKTDVDAFLKGLVQDVSSYELPHVFNALSKIAAQTHPDMRAANLLYFTEHDGLGFVSDEMAQRFHGCAATCFFHPSKPEGVRAQSEMLRSTMTRVTAVFFLLDQVHKSGRQVAVGAVQAVPLRADRLSDSGEPLSQGRVKLFQQPLTQDGGPAAWQVIKTLGLYR